MRTALKRGEAVAALSNAVNVASGAEEAAQGVTHPMEIGVFVDPNYTYAASHLRLWLRPHAVLAGTTLLFRAWPG